MGGVLGDQRLEILYGKGLILLSQGYVTEVIGRVRRELGAGCRKQNFLCFGVFLAFVEKPSQLNGCVRHMLALRKRRQHLLQGSESEGRIVGTLVALPELEEGQSGVWILCLSRGKCSEHGYGLGPILLLEVAIACHIFELGESRSGEVLRQEGFKHGQRLRPLLFLIANLPDAKTNDVQSFHGNALGLEYGFIRNYCVGIAFEQEKVLGPQENYLIQVFIVLVGRQENFAASQAEIELLGLVKAIGLHPYRIGCLRTLLVNLGENRRGFSELLSLHKSRSVVVVQIAD